MKEPFRNINFEITHSCNQQCLYCYNSSELSTGSSEKPIKTLSKLFCVARVQQITFTGGEPTLSACLKECVIHARLNNAKVAIITNGSTENQQLFRDLISIGVSHFQITVNSHHAEIHDRLAGTIGAWRKTIENIEFITSNGGKVIPTMVLSNQNTEHIERLFDLFTQYGLKTVMANRYNLSAGGFAEKITLSAEGLNRVFRKIDDMAHDRNFKVTSNVCTPHCILNPGDFRHIGFGNCPDDPKLKPITIDSNGNVRICNHSRTILGNIFKHSFDEMLYSDYALSWVSNIPEYCTNCSIYDDCKGGCKAASEQIHDNHLLVDPVVTTS